jgi:dicarboxylate/amino acid:cation (Na+ or H+) symporter, DAACS family
VMFFAVIFGVALASMSSRRAVPMRRWLESLNDVAVTIVTMILRVAPFGVACLLFGITSRFGGDVLMLLGWFVATVLGALVVHVVLTIASIVRLSIGMPATSFFSRTREALTTAFSTSSSSAALPTSLAAAELNLGIPAQVAGFVLPLGSTLCMNGTALFQAVAVVTLAQAFGIALSSGALFALTAVCVVTAIGAAGVPGGSIPLLIGALRLFDVPVEGIALIIGVDRLLDMARTTVNVTSAIAATAFVARSEGVWTPSMLPVAAGADVPRALSEASDG